ncbi:hypothetical protein Tco_0615139 [Tanacetum coccineum]
MGKPGEDGDASPVTMGKKSKKNKNKINDLPDVDRDGYSQVVIDDALPKEKKGHEHWEKKKKKKESELNEDGVEDRPDKGDLVDDADLGEKKKTKKKRESRLNEDGVEDRPDKGDLVDDADLGEKKKKKKKKKKKTKKKRESGSNEDGVEDQIVDDVDFWDNLLEHRPGDICRKRLGPAGETYGEYGVSRLLNRLSIGAERYLTGFSLKPERHGITNLFVTP